MNEKYLDAYFINPAIEYGISSYLSYKENKEYKRAHTFEMYVIKALTIIYGEKSIILPYKIDNERAFECNLLMYNLKESSMHNFIKLMNEYYNFMQEFNSNTKANGLISEIEKILMEMILKRAKQKTFTDEEIREFDTIFNPINGDLKKIKTLLSNDSGLIIRTWENSKAELTNTQVNLMAINPNLLNPNLYSKFGLDINRVALLSEQEIDDINKKIIDEENRVIDYNNMGKKTKRRKIIITSGNGFVDKLMLVSIMATELMIGMILISVLGGY